MLTGLQIGNIGKELLNFDAVLVWINPVSPTLDGNQESRGGDDGLDAMLRRVASKGVIVSGNPETIKKMGTKKVIFDTKEILGVDLKFIVRINQ